MRPWPRERNPSWFWHSDAAGSLPFHLTTIYHGCSQEKKGPLSLFFFAFVHQPSCTCHPIAQICVCCGYFSVTWPLWRETTSSTGIISPMRSHFTPFLKTTTSLWLPCASIINYPIKDFLCLNSTMSFLSEHMSLFKAVKPVWMIIITPEVKIVPLKPTVAGVVGCFQVAKVSKTSCVVSVLMRGHRRIMSSIIGRHTCPTPVLWNLLLHLHNCTNIFWNMCHVTPFWCLYLRVFLRTLCSPTLL